MSESLHLQRFGARRDFDAYRFLRNHHSDCCRWFRRWHGGRRDAIPNLADIVASLVRPSTDLDWPGACGNCTPETGFFIASTTKVHTSAIILRLAQRSELSLDDRAVDIIWEGLTCAGKGRQVLQLAVSAARTA